MNTFCVNCGTRLTAAVAGAPTAPPPGYPPVAAPPYPGYPPAYPYYPGPPPRTATFSNILSGMFDVWTKNFVNFFVVFLVLALVTGGLGAVLSLAIFGTLEPGGGFVPGTPPTGTGSTDLGALVLYAIASVILLAILNSVVAGGMTEYAIRRFRGESMTLQHALGRGFERFLSILGANILLTLAIFALFLLPLVLAFSFILVAGASGSSGAVLAALCGLALAIVVGGVVAIFVYISLSLFAPAIMMENQRAVGGLSRSWAITKGHRWSLFGAIVIAVILVAIISAVINFPAALVGNPVVSIVASAIASGVVGSWLVILAAVAYDLIVRPVSPPFGAPPPYMPGPAMGLPPGAAQPPFAPPPAGPPPGP